MFPYINQLFVGLYAILVPYLIKQFICKGFGFWIWSAYAKLLIVKGLQTAFLESTASPETFWCFFPSSWIRLIVLSSLPTYPGAPAIGLFSSEEALTHYYYKWVIPGQYDRMATFPLPYSGMNLAAGSKFFFKVITALFLPGYYGRPALVSTVKDPHPLIVFLEDSFWILSFGFTESLLNCYQGAIPFDPESVRNALMLYSSGVTDPLLPL